MHKQAPFLVFSGCRGDPRRVRPAGGFGLRPLPVVPGVVQPGPRETAFTLWAPTAARKITRQRAPARLRYLVSPQAKRRPPPALPGGCKPAAGRPTILPSHTRLVSSSTSTPHAPPPPDFPFKEFKPGVPTVKLQARPSSACVHDKTLPPQLEGYPKELPRDGPSPPVSGSSAPFFFSHPSAGRRPCCPVFLRQC